MSGSDDAADTVAENSHYRSYEVYQRERVGDTTNLIRPRQLISDEFRCDPYPSLTILRENYPCYRDWVTNRFWITRYDDVTSVLADTANFAARSRRSTYPTDCVGRSLWGELEIGFAVQNRIDAGLDRLCSAVVDAMRADGDLAVSLAAGTVVEVLAAVLGIEHHIAVDVWSATWRMQQGAGWDPHASVLGRRALEELTALFDQLLAARADGDGDDLVSVAARLEPPGGSVTGRDIATTLLEADIETLHGGLANMWCAVLTDDEQMDVLVDDPRLVKFAWLETLRHSPPVLGAARWARHEVERFGRLLPEGALVWCSAAAANRDPRVFGHSDQFDVRRADLCQREPRGQYRADGLPSGISIGTGLPSTWPAEPRERPRSHYALTRDIAVAVSRAVLDATSHITLASEVVPELSCRRLGEMHTCWHLPTTMR